MLFSPLILRTRSHHSLPWDGLVGNKTYLFLICSMRRCAVFEAGLAMMATAILMGSNCFCDAYAAQAHQLAPLDRASPAAEGFLTISKDATP
jgi:hypothetical protein